MSQPVWPLLPSPLRPAPVDHDREHSCHFQVLQRCCLIPPVMVIDLPPKSSELTLLDLLCENGSGPLKIFPFLVGIKVLSVGGMDRPRRRKEFCFLVLGRSLTKFPQHWRLLRASPASA